MRTVPNVSLAAEEGTSTVYLVVGDSKFRVGPADFAALGFRGDRVITVAPETLAPFTEKPLAAQPPVRPSEVFFDCGEDGSNVFGSWVVNCQPSSSLVQLEILVGGWLHQVTPDSPASPWMYVAANGVEDVHYDLRLDPVFVQRMYGPGGLSLRLDGVRYPGNPPDAVPLPFAAGPPSPDGRPAITYNSWILPGSGDDIHGELNSWHTKDTAGLFRRRIVGRGPAPNGWIAPLTADTDAYFPFNPFNPDGGPRNLRVGDYVIMRGPLWQDRYHDCDAASICDPWDTGLTRHHAYLEMHPIDWVMRAAPPGPNARITTQRPVPPPCTAAATGAPMTKGSTIVPDFTPTRSSRRLEVRTVERLDDLRPGMIVPASVTDLQTNRQVDHVDWSVTVTPTGTEQGRWKGSWLVGWSEVDERDRLWFDDSLPAGADLHGENDGWTWISDPPPFHGTSSHQSALLRGPHQHFFYSQSTPLPVGVGDTLFTAVFLDPADPPDEVMLQWYSDSGGWGHRAYWGADLKSFAV
jgi:hypothetical protein